jgi:hypothetical protein
LEKSKTNTDVAISMPRISRSEQPDLMMAIRCPSFEMGEQHKGMGNIICHNIFGKNENAN